MIGRYLTTVLVMMFCAGIATEGLDSDGRFDSVIAVYHFEDVTDSGPRGFDGNLVTEASIVDDGKIDKCLQIRGDGAFVTVENQHFSLMDREFSIVAWVKLQQQTHIFNILAAGANDDNTYAGGIQLLIEPSGNIKGQHYDFADEKSVSIETEDSNIADDNWHHIAYCKHADSYSLYIDGEVVKKERSADYLGFAGDGTFIRISGPSKVDLTGSVRVDEVGFFEIGFSMDAVKGLYDDGLTDFLEAMPVDPRERVAMTWGGTQKRQMVVSEIRSLYRDENDLFRTVIKRIYEEKDADREQWHLKRIEFIYEDPELPVPSENPAVAVEQRHGWLIPPEWEFISEVWAYERKRVQEDVYDHESEVGIIRE